MQVPVVHSWKLGLFVYCGPHECPTCNNKNLVSLIYVNAVNYCCNVMRHRITLLGCSCSDFQPINHGFYMNSEDQNLIVDTKYQQQILCQLIMANRYVGITNKFRIVNYGFFFSIL